MWPEKSFYHDTDNMKPEDVGLSSKLQFFSAKDVVKGTSPIVTSTTIYKCNEFSVRLSSSYCSVNQFSVYVAHEKQRSTTSFCNIMILAGLEVLKKTRKNLESFWQIQLWGLQNPISLLTLLTCSSVIFFCAVVSLLSSCNCCYPLAQSSGNDGF